MHEFKKQNSDDHDGLVLDSVIWVIILIIWKQDSVKEIRRGYIFSLFVCISTMISESICNLNDWEISGTRHYRISAGNKHLYFDTHTNVKRKSII